MLPVYILAGGRGTRLGELTKNRPKAMVEVDGRPFIYYVLHRLAWQGVREVIMCVGYGAKQMIRELGFHQFGMTLYYSIDVAEQPGTLWALRNAQRQCPLGDSFFVIYGDAFLSVDLEHAEEAWRHSDTDAMMTVCRRAQWAPANAVVREHRVTDYGSGLGQYCDYGLQALTVDALGVDVEGYEVGDLYACLAREGQLYAYEVTRRFYEINTPESLKETKDALRHY